MAKILTGKELAQIAVDATDELCEDQYEKFVTSLANLITEHFGGRVGLIQYVEDLNDITVAISQDGNIPENGGIYKSYDTDGEL